MVVSTKRLLEVITEQEKPLLEQLEKKIDETLTEKFDGNPITISVPYTNDCEANRYGNKAKIRDSALNHLLNQYKSQGWSSVKLQIQSEKSYIEFKYTS